MKEWTPVLLFLCRTFHSPSPTLLTKPACHKNKHLIPDGFPGPFVQRKEEIHTVDVAAIHESAPGHGFSFARTKTDLGFTSDIFVPNERAPLIIS